MQPTKLTLAMQVRQLRKDAGLTQLDLAQKSGLSMALISMVERGYDRLTRPTLRLLAQGLGVPADFLVGARQLGKRRKKR